ncbi:MAG: galactokinase [Candidatus Methylacidiphilales bacterium]
MNTNKAHFEVRAPGRAEVLGNHTDYNEGLVLSIAIHVGTTIEVKPLEGRTLRLASRGLGQEWEGNLDHLEPLTSPGPTWPNYIIGVAQGLMDRGVSLHGAEFCISSNLPIGAGLSSSAALEMAAVLAFQNRCHFEMTALDLARVGQSAEHRFAGVKCGLLDQISVLCGKKNHLTFIDCRSFEIRHLPFPDDWVFVLAHSGVNHALTGGEYNERREACERAAAALGLRSLRDITPGELDARQDELDSLTFRRAMHPVGETARVAHAVSCLARGDADSFGRLMRESHDSSIRYFENSCPELDFLVDTACAHPACAGARLSGGGFGGATINLVRAKQVEEFSKALSGAYLAHYGSEPLLLSTAPCDGAQVV